MKVINQESLSQFSTVRLVQADGNSIVSIDEAWKAAQLSGLDLIVVSDNADPPVVKIQDYRKIEFEKKKAKKAQRKAQRMLSNQGALKEIHLKINISDHDLTTKINRAKKFIAKGDKVKLTVQLRGRERDYDHRAWEVIDRFAEQCQPCRVFKTTGGPNINCLLEPESTKTK